MQYVAVFATKYISSLSSFVPNFRILSQLVAEKYLKDKNVHMYFIGVSEGKTENLKRGRKMRISISAYLFC